MLKILIKSKRTKIKEAVPRVQLSINRKSLLLRNHKTTINLYWASKYLTVVVPG